VFLSMVRASGSGNDGYADDLSLVFSGVGALACNPDAPVDGGSRDGATAVCGIGSTPAPVGTFNDDFSSGLRSRYWSVTQSTAGLYTYDDSQGDVRLAKVGNSPGGFQTVQVSPNLQNMGGPVAGDFEASVDFANAVLQLQPGSNDNESVRFDNFHLQGGCVVP
jgi:hypothetical protein